MKYLVIGAMEEEISLIKNSLRESESISISYLNVFHGYLEQHEVYLVKCGIGKVASAAAASILIHALDVDAVINTGSAGGFDPSLCVGDVVIADKLLHHDVDVQHFGYELGQVPQMPLYYESDTKLIEKAKKAINDNLSIQVKVGLICSGDSFIGSDEAAVEIRQNFKDIAAVEMEGAAIAQVCHLMNIPFVVIRSLSDIAGKTSSVSFENYLEIAGKNSAELVMDIIMQ